MKISIITAVFNNRPFIESCIRSVRAQSYPGMEYLIIDGGSTDGTLDVISRLTPHARLPARVISEPDRGIYDALNKGIRMASGDVIGFLHVDDLFASERVVETVAGCFETHGVDSCYGDLLYVDKDDTNKIIRYWKSRPYERGLLRTGWMPPHPTFFVRREVYGEYGSFNTTFKIASDYELMMRFLGKHGISTRYIPEVLIKMRVGGASNRSIGNLIRKSFEDYKAMKMHDIGGLGTLFRKNLSKIPQFFVS